MTRKEAAIEFYNILNFIKKYEGSYTYYNDIKSWTQLSPKFSRCLTIEELKAAMRTDKRFGKRDFQKLDSAIDYFLESKNHKN